MGNTKDDGDGIGYTISAEDLTAEGIESAKRRLNDLGASHNKVKEVARLGFWGIGEAAENAAQRLGVPGQASRQLGNAIEGLASKLGKAGGAFGVAVFAGTALYAVYSHLAEQQRRVREETIKAADAAGTWIEAALKEEAQTEKLTAAKRKYAQALFDENKAKIEKGTPEQEKLVAEFTEKYQLALQLQKEGRVSEFMTVKGLAEEVEQRKRALALAESTLQKMRAQAELYSPENRGKVGPQGPSGSSPAFTQGEFAQMREIMLLEREREEREKNFTLEESIAMKENMLHERAQKSWVSDIEERIKLKNEIKKAQEEETEHLEQMEARKRAAQMQTLQNFSQALQMMSQLGGAHARKYFEMYKVSAIAETIISTSRAAMKAYAEGGPYVGAALAASIVAVGAANVARIQSQQFGSGSGAIGTYSANPATGNPDNGGYRYFNYEQSKYGTGWRPGDGQGGGTTNIYIQGDVLDGDSFQKKVAGAYNRTLKDGSHDSRQTVRRYA